MVGAAAEREEWSFPVWGELRFDTLVLYWHWARNPIWMEGRHELRGAPN